MSTTVTDVTDVTDYTGRKHSYVEVPSSDIPDGVAFDTVPAHEGQIQQVAYGRRLSERSLACAGAKYRRFIDLSIPVGVPRRVVYYRLCTK